MSNKSRKKPIFKPDEIQEAGNNLLRTTISNLRFTLSDVHWIARSQEDQTDKGIDFEYELEEKSSKKTIFIFKIQNKGTDSSLAPLKSSNKKGLIPFTIKVRNAHYYRNEIPNVLIFTICDNKNKLVYWHPIQLDDHIDKRLVEAKNNQKESIQIYINPKKVLSKKNIELFFKDLIDSHRAQSERFNVIISDNPYFQNNPIHFRINKSQQILNQIYELLSARFNGLNTIPINEIKSLYPFDLEKNVTHNYSYFTLTTDNEQLFDFFKSLKIESNGKIIFTKKELTKGVVNYEEKTKYILQTLTDSLVFKLNYKNKEKKIFYNKIKDPDCGSCYFYGFEFVKSLSKLNEVPNSINDRFEHAYFQFELGYYAQAAEHFLSLSKELEQGEQGILYFIANYNLVQLRRYISIDHAKGECSEILGELNLINLDNIQKSVEKTETSELIKRIKEHSFIKESSQEIRKLVSSIQDHYYSYLQGHWNSKKNVWELINEFGKVDAFLNGNSIVYNQYTDFLEVADLFIEGLFASHSIKGQENSRLVKFDDWMIEKIIFYGDPDKISKHFNRYNLQELIYKKSNKDGRSFNEKMHNLLIENSNIRKAFYKCSDSNNTYFWNKFNKLFNNMLLLASLINLPKTQINHIMKDLLIFVENDKSIFPHNMKFIKTFLIRKGNQISPANLKRFLLLVLKTEKLQRDYFVETIKEQINLKNRKISISKHDLLAFEHLAFNEDKDSPLTPLSLIYLYEIIQSETAKEKTRSQIKKSLKGSFNHNLYYNATLSHVISISTNSDLFKKFIESSIPPQKRTSFNSLFTGIPDITYPNLNALINVCYKHEIDLTDKIFDKLKGISDYFDWLLDMKGFNYDLFDPKWINEYLTIYYAKEIQRYSIINEIICEYLMDNKDSRLEMTYIKLYCGKKINTN